MSAGLPEFPDDDFQMFIYENLARVGKALSSPVRLLILNMLCNGEHTVDDIAKTKNLTVSNVSSHLQRLKAVNLVRSRRAGKYIFYSTNDKDTKRFMREFRSFCAGSLVEIKAAIKQVDQSNTRVGSLSREELLGAISNKAMQVLDVRPRSEFKRAHLSFAINIPFEELEDKLQANPGLLNKEVAVVVYCRGSFCILADKAIDILNKFDIKAFRTDETAVEWELDGLPIETT